MPSRGKRPSCQPTTMGKTNWPTYRNTQHTSIPPPRLAGREHRANCDRLAQAAWHIAEARRLLVEAGL